MIRSTAIALVLIASAGVASAHDHGWLFDGDHQLKSKCHDFRGDDSGFLQKVAFDRPICAPEIDPGAAASSLTLLLGGLAVLRGRRSRPTPKHSEEA